MINCLGAVHDVISQRAMAATGLPLGANCKDQPFAVCMTVCMTFNPFDFRPSGFTTKLAVDCWSTGWDVLQLGFSKACSKACCCLARCTALLLHKHCLSRWSVHTTCRGVAAHENTGSRSLPNSDDGSRASTTTVHTHAIPALIGQSHSAVKPTHTHKHTCDVATE